MNKNMTEGLGAEFRRQLGRIKVDGDRFTAQFWIRTLKLEEHISFVQGKLYQRAEPLATTPIISEFKVDDHFEFIYALTFTVDAIEALDVRGVVYFCSPGEERLKAIEVRNELGDHMIAALEKHMFELPEKPIEMFMSTPQAEGDDLGNRPAQTSRSNPPDVGS
jgi:hypothetical protein